MAIKKSELYSSLWEGCNQLRGGMDASEYKNYVLVLLFVKYVSEKKDSLIDVPEGGGFKDMLALKGKPNIGEEINKILAKLAEANGLKGVIDVADFANEDKLGKGKEMVDMLSELISIFEKPELNFANNRAEDDDILGDAYEYLMRHFATESGKSKGQFYTPAEVSRIMSKLISIEKAERAEQSIYDPTCGSGSLLLKAADAARIGLTLYGQENDTSTSALAKINMILHNNETASIEKGNTLANPVFKEADGSLKKFDYVVANPPFSFKAWSKGFSPENDSFDRFTGFGIPPEKNGDYAFLLHIIKSMKSKGKGAVILPHGVLFRGNSEGEIRQNLIKRGYIKGIIGLPANLFYGTGIPACIVVLDKENAEVRKGIFMIDASKGFAKDGNKNRLREQDIHKIVDVFTKQIQLDKYSRMVSVEEIAVKNEYNLNIPRYIDSQESEDIQSIEAHLLGGIPNKDVEDLADYWAVYPALRAELFSDSNRKGFSVLKVENDKIKSTIYEYPEFKDYSKKIDAVFANWKERTKAKFNNLTVGSKPKELIFDISEDILNTFADVHLIDKYDIYQHLMTYWKEVLQDDIYLINADGWKVGGEIEFKEDKKKNFAESQETAKKPKKEKKKEFEGKLIPKNLLINRYFANEKAEIEALEASRDDAIQKIEELVEENSGEDGLLENCKNEKGEVSKAEASKRAKEIKKSADDAQEFKIIESYLSIVEQQAEANKRIKEKEEQLEQKLLKKYPELSETEIKDIAINDKWMAQISSDIASEMERISQRLTQRIKQLAERYDTPLPEIANDVENLTQKVDAHLQKMGFKW